MKKILILIIGIMANTVLFAQRVGINTDNPQAALHVEGDMIISKIEVVDNAQILGVDSDGHIKKALFPPRKYTSVESKREQSFDNTQLEDVNAGRYVEVDWGDDEIAANNMMTKEGNTFVFDEDMFCQVSGHIGYRSYTMIDRFFVDGYTISSINVTIQCQRNGSNDWENLSTVTGTFFGVESLLFKMLIAPTVGNLFAKGDRIRMVVSRPTGIGGDLLHRNTDGTNPLANIGIPPGCLYSKGLKIISM